MGTKKMILLLFLAFYFSCGFYQAKILSSEAHISGGRGSGGEVNGDGSRSPSTPGSSNFIPIYAANAHHKRHHGAASKHRSHNGYLALFAAMFFACLCT
ncbi:hypothetical protein P3S67_026410 [Capsicum chacoense]|nr:putative protein jagunal -like protein 1-like [Capsicum annuum]